MYKLRLWFARVVVLYAFLIFAYLAFVYIGQPLEHIDRYGIAATGSPESVNFLRAGPGALFAGMAVVAAIGMALPASLRQCLLVLVIFNGCIVAARLFGMSIDGVTPLQLTELRDEGISWLFFAAAFWILPAPHRLNDS